IGPIGRDDAFDVDDFELLVDYEHKKHVKPIHDYLSALFDNEKMGDDYANCLLRAVVILGRLAQSSFVGDAFEKPDVIQRQGACTDSTISSMITVGNPLASVIRVQAILDPMTETGQKWAPILEASYAAAAAIGAFFNTDLLVKELPIKRFYRYLIPPRLTFNVTTGAIIPDRIAFAGTPKQTLLTMGLDTVSTWVAMPTASSYDLDNLRLTTSSALVEATFTLSELLVEGHVRDLTPDNPRGLQLVFSPSQGGTIVMANLGYFQLRAPPGMYRLSLREGRSSEFYHLLRIDHSMWAAFEDEDEDGQDASGSRDDATGKGAATPVDTRIVIESLEGAILFPVVRKNPGYETRELLASNEETASSSEGGIVGKLKDQATARQSADINIFSVASGHLYERFLSVMMLSVMRHTSSTVKFWFIENFLSPAFKDFLPHLAAKLGFQYELITYQWPHWLRKQTEKQRTIWSYKILFLDVLFPLDLDKVIFVDADQIVRADLQELVDLDLKGAPYGYTPFCSDREGMDRFRFWREGYWKNHLRGKPYHISALYVVDLKRFRAMAAGDILRGQYQALSADPNSLANLDQDLPNNLQDDVPIYSLPQEWLWCETWCSDEALAKAKTIDLCNNPLTKEPKLDRARRQVPEWSEYDTEITA
ncbi:nucleotide-diphospho-sugar transferase, partial [Syncephalis pseudoplumigaleata]